jgi:hypothetical protein
MLFLIGASLGTILGASLASHICLHISKHRDLNFIQKHANGHHTILRGSPTMTLSLFTPRSYDIWGLDKEENNPYEFPAEKTIPAKGRAIFYSLVVY